MAFAGLRGTGDWGTDERPKNFREFIMWRNPNGSAPLTALLSRARSESVDDPEFAWWEEKLTAVRLQVNFTTGFSTTDNTITVAADGLRAVAGDVFQIEKTETSTYDNEIITVSSVTSDTVVVFKRAQAGTTAAPLLNSVFLTRIGSAFEEGSVKATFTQRNPTKLRNYCQIFKTAMGQTKTAKKTYARTGDAWKNDKRRRAFDHSVGLEFAFLFGVDYEDTSGSKPKRYTKGLRKAITTNVKIFTTTPTEDTLLDAIYKVFDYESEAGDQRIVLAGNGFLNTLNKLARKSSSSRVNFDSVIKLYGMSLQRWVTPQGEFAVKTHPLMNLHGRYTNSAFIIDPTGLRYRYLRDTAFEDNIQTPGQDAQEAQWLTECGLEVNHEETFAYLGNFTDP